MQMDWGARTSSSAAFGVSPKASELLRRLTKKRVIFSPVPVGGTPTGGDRDDRAPNRIASSRLGHLYLSLRVISPFHSAGSTSVRSSWICSR
jgi:hypothetical protein